MQVDTNTITTALGGFFAALVSGGAITYNWVRRIKRDSFSDAADKEKASTDKAQNDLQRRTMELVQQSVEQWKAHADEMRALAREAQAQARRDRRLRQIAEARLIRVQKQAADDREADRREVERLTRRITELEANIGQRRKDD